MEEERVNPIKRGSIIQFNVCVSPSSRRKWVRKEEKGAGSFVLHVVFVYGHVVMEGEGNI